MLRRDLPALGNVEPRSTSADRLVWIRRQLMVAGKVRITSAASVLGVSAMTVRRDLHRLEGMGAALRVRGGAVAIDQRRIRQRDIERAGARAAIVGKLLKLVPATGLVLLDGSPLMLRFARSVAGARDLVVVSNGPAMLAAVQGKPGIRAVLTGGTIDHSGTSLVGPAACRAIDAVLACRAFISLGDVAVGDGAELRQVTEAMARSAGEIILAGESSRIDATCPAPGVAWSSVSILVTELDPTDQALAPYRKLVGVL
ncbi:MAG TPA: DeoR/GlpR family DNA-binding transcription regulator [Aeromicrobium sp.]|nr:DeoR/GlpR family DNA-binding transcription regulator [Aeromicrobium sp.]